jgi:hypothetical protein
MPRLRIRIELNRGGIGVPLHKLASVVDEARKFFYLLAEDIHVDQSQGDWLGFDFGNESLNFTAEFIGPVTAEQVSAFHAAFDGTTSLRRNTIAQFARITEAIEQDELIGFGLYMSDEGNEPSDWRCLSRRDALRITEEIQMLIEASGEMDHESHLPAVTNTGVGARLFSDRRERGLESAKWTAYVREVEANMDRRISRVEHVLEGQSGLIEDLHSKSTSTEDSVRKLLTAVEGFCAHTTRQLEAISAPVAVPSAAFAALSEPAVMTSVAQEAPPTPVIHAPMAQAATSPMPVADAPMAQAAKVSAPIVDAATAQPATASASVLHAATAKAATAPSPAATESSVAQGSKAPLVVVDAPKTQAATAAASQPTPLRAPIVESGKKPEAAVVKPGSPPVSSSLRPKPTWRPPVEFAPEGKRDWRLVAGFALLGIGVVILATWTWQNLVSEPGVQRVAATSNPPANPLPDHAPAQAAPPPPPPAKPSTLAPPALTNAGGRVSVQASELTWVALRDASGKPMLARLFSTGDTQSFDIPDGATLRIGNASGLKILFNGNPIGSVGPHGKVREVVFTKGSYKIIASD